MENTTLLQGAIILLSLPVLIFIIIRIRKEKKSRQALVNQVKENDLKHVFNAGESEGQSDNAILNAIIENAQEASSFVKSMAQNNYEVQWKGLNEKNLTLNKDTLAGNLVYMRENLKRIKEEDQKRNWMNEGLTQFSSLVRNYQHDPKVLADQCISFLTTHLHSQQGSLFVLEEEEDQSYLKLASCYAFDKKKIKEGRIEIGDGLVGQTFLEGETTVLNQVPEGYLKITSGLGDATPRHVVIVPLKYDRHTLAIVELASFSPYDTHHVSFIEKSGEFLASAILNAQTTSKMKTLLDQAKITEEEMRQREEEMRQNMEELQATQEALIRKEKEMTRPMANKA
jgi:putative methionine-R-sulfoxide reductase with GAF domain